MLFQPFPPKIPAFFGQTVYDCSLKALINLMHSQIQLVGRGERERERHVLLIWRIIAPGSRKGEGKGEEGRGGNVCQVCQFLVILRSAGYLQLVGCFVVLYVPVDRPSV